MQIGEGAFRRYGADGGRASFGGGQDWAAWFGEIRVDRNVRIGGFKTSGLIVKVITRLTSTLPSRRLLSAFSFAGFRRAVHAPS